MLKGGPRWPPFFLYRERSVTVSCRPSSSRPWLSSPLCLIPPFSWDHSENALGPAMAAAWHAHPKPALSGISVEHQPNVWANVDRLIPDVDYGREISSVKHKRVLFVKNFSCDSSSHGGSQLLFGGVTFDRERDQAIDQLRVRQSTRFPHLRVHADRREAGDGVHFVEIQDASVARE